MRRERRDQLKIVPPQTALRSGPARAGDGLKSLGRKARWARRGKGFNVAPGNSCPLDAADAAPTTPSRGTKRKDVWRARRYRKGG